MTGWSLDKDAPQGYNMRIVLGEGRVTLHYTDPLGRPRTALLMYYTNSTLQWISSGGRTTATIGTIETDDNGKQYLKIPTTE